MKSSNEIGRSTLVEEILQKVAAEEDVAVVDLPPLYDAADPDALTALVESSGAGGITVQIDYCGYSVTVTSTGEPVSVSIAENGSPPAQ